METKSYQHTKIGILLFNLCFMWTKLVVYNKWIYYFLMFTWGALFVLVGLVKSVFYNFIRLFNKDITINKCGLMTIIKSNKIRHNRTYGIIATNRKDCIDGDLINKISFGKSIQQTLFGPLYLIIVVFPAIILRLNNKNSDDEYGKF